MWYIRLARNLISLTKQQINLESWCNIAYSDVVHVFTASSSISLMRQSRNLESCDTTKPALTFIRQICVESCDESSLCIVAPSLVGVAKEVDTPTLQRDGAACEGLGLRLAPHDQIRREWHRQDQLLVEAGANFAADMQSNEGIQKLSQATSISTWIKTIKTIYPTRVNERLRQLNQATSILTWIRTIYPTRVNERLQQLNQATGILTWIRTIYPTQMNERLQQLNQATSILTWIRTIYSTQMNHRIQWLNQATSISVWIKTVHPAQMKKRLQQLCQATSISTWIKTIYPDSLITTVLSHAWLISGWWLTCAVCCQLVLLFSQMAQPSDSTVTVIHHYRLKLSESQMVYPLTVWYCSLLSGDLQTALFWQKLLIVWYCSLLSGDPQTALFWEKLSWGYPVWLTGC